MIGFAFRNHNSSSDVQKVFKRSINEYKEVKLGERFSYQDGQ